jgi:hypothetical protein
MGRGLILMYNLGIRLEGNRKKPQVRAAGLSAEIWAQ